MRSSAIVLFTVLAVLAVAASAAPLSFLVVGNIGGQGEAPYTTPAQIEVANAMGTTDIFLTIEVRITWSRDCVGGLAEAKPPLVLIFAFSCPPLPATPDISLS